MKDEFESCLMGDSMVRDQLMKAKEKYEQEYMRQADSCIWIKFEPPVSKDTFAELLTVLKIKLRKKHGHANFISFIVKESSVKTTLTQNISVLFKCKPKT